MSSVKTEPRQSPSAGPTESSLSSQQEPREDLQVLMDELGDAVSDYCQKRPGVAGGLIFAIGFFIGWRLKPWLKPW